MDASQRRELSNDLNRSSGGFELAIVVGLFAAVGLLVDRWLGIMPVATISFFVIGVVGAVAKLWIGYDRQMRRMEEEGPWARPHS